MEFLFDYWYVILGIVAVLAVIGFSIYKFLGLPTKEQISKVKEWLLYAVIKAESDLGSDTGIIKLRRVYDMFISKFPVTAKLISFNTFSAWVDSALEEMKVILEKNNSVKELIETQKIQ